MDGDSFFVACEVAKNPKLRGLPAVTGEERGIASALSYEAKALGLKRGDPIFKIKRDFPQVIILPGDYKSYAKFSTEMFDIVRRYADDVEEYSIDECFADLTGLERPLKMTYKEIAERIKKEITEELGLSVSLGVAPTKGLAKVASKWQKPNGLTVIEIEDAPKYLNRTPIGKIWGIGYRTEKKLRKLGIETALDFVNLKIEWIRENMPEPFEVIWRELRGQPILKIHSEPKETYSSIQKTRTFWPATNDKNFLISQFSKNIELACSKARYYDLIPKSVSWFLKTQQFRYHTFGITLPVPTNSPEIITEHLRKFFHKMWRPDVLYRTTGVTLYELTPKEATQLDLFGGSEKTQKFETIHEQIDNLEKKFGRGVVHLASASKAIKRKVKGTDSEDLDRNLLFL